MLTLRQADHELKIIWCLNEDQSEDLMGFLKINAIEEESPLKSCSFYFLGEKEISVLLWRALLSSLKVLLDRKIKLRFICTSEKIEGALHAFGFSLLGEIVLDIQETFASLASHSTTPGKE